MALGHEEARSRDAQGRSAAGPLDRQATATCQYPSGARHDLPASARCYGLGQLGTPFDAQPANRLRSGACPPLGVAGPTAPIRAALDEVERLRAELADREAEIVERERAVDAAQILIEERLAALSATEDRLTALLALSDTAAETDIDRLTRVYETMEPDAAAPLFAQMETSFAAGFLSRMSPAASAALMSELDPQTAYAISVVLATRNAGAPRRDTAEDRAAETGD